MCREEVRWIRVDMYVDTRVDSEYRQVYRHVVDHRRVCLRLMVTWLYGYVDLRVAQRSSCVLPSDSKIASNTAAYSRPCHVEPTATACLHLRLVSIRVFRCDRARTQRHVSTHVYARDHTHVHTGSQIFPLQGSSHVHLPSLSIRSIPCHP